MSCKSTRFTRWNGCDPTKCQSHFNDCWVGPKEEKTCNASYPVPKDTELSFWKKKTEIKGYTCCPNATVTSDKMTASVAVKKKMWKPASMYIYVGIGLVSTTPHHVVLVFCTGHHVVLVFCTGYHSVYKSFPLLLSQHIFCYHNSFAITAYRVFPFLDLWTSTAGKSRCCVGDLCFD
jgi:hypothetical protein